MLRGLALRELLGESRLLLFGLLMSFVSSAGQTFFISLFSADFRAAFDLSHGEFGAIYSAATLTSACVLVWAGGLLDRIDLRLFSAGVLIGLSAAGFVAGSTQGPVTLFLAIFMLRFFGQGLSSHVALTSAARYAPDHIRGKAVSVASLGFPLGEAVWPILVVAAIAAYGWRESYIGAALILFFGFLPLAVGLLWTHGKRHEALLQRTEQAHQDGVQRQWTRGEVLRDPLFRWTLLGAMAPSFIVTGILFHQIHLVESKGWLLEAFAAGYAAYAIFQIGMSLITGPLVDRFGARSVAPFYMLPMTLGCVALGLSDSIIAGVVFLSAIGVTSGASSNVLSTLWAELYGVRNLGAIKALVNAALVGSSALSPFTMGWFLDQGVAIETIIFACVGYGVVAMIILWSLYRRPSMKFAESKPQRMVKNEHRSDNHEDGGV